MTDVPFSTDDPLAGAAAQDELDQESADLENAADLGDVSALERGGDSLLSTLSHAAFEVGVGFLFLWALPLWVAPLSPPLANLPYLVYAAPAAIILFGHFRKESTLLVATAVAVKTLFGAIFVPLFLLIRIALSFGDAPEFLLSEKERLRRLAVDCVRLSRTLRRQRIKVHKNYHKLLKMAIDHQRTILKAQARKELKRITDEFQKALAKELGRLKKSLYRAIRRALMTVGRGLLRVTPFLIEACIATWGILWGIVGLLLMLLYTSVLDLVWYWSLLAGLLWPAYPAVIGVLIYAIGLLFNEIMSIIEMTVKAVIWLAKMLFKTAKGVNDAATKLRNPAGVDPMPKIKRIDDPEKMVEELYAVYHKDVGDTLILAAKRELSKLRDALGEQPGILKPLDALLAEELEPGKKTELLFAKIDELKREMAAAEEGTGQPSVETDKFLDEAEQSPDEEEQYELRRAA